MLFAGVFLGFTVGSATSPYVSSSPPCEGSLLHLLAGLVGLGLGRTLLSETAKLLCDEWYLALKDSKGKDTMVNVVRSFWVTLLTAGAIAGTPPPCEWW